MADLPNGPADRRLDPEEFAQAVARQFATTPPKRTRKTAVRRSLSMVALIGIGFGAGIAIASVVVWMTGQPGGTSDEVLGVVVSSTTTTETSAPTTTPETTTTAPTTTTTTLGTTTTSNDPTTTTAGESESTIVGAPTVDWVRCNNEPCDGSFERTPQITVTFQCSNSFSCVGEFAYPTRPFQNIRSGDRVYTTFINGTYRIRVTGTRPEHAPEVVEVTFTVPE